VILTKKVRLTLKLRGTASPQLKTPMKKETPPPEKQMPDVDTMLSWGREPADSTHKQPGLPPQQDQEYLQFVLSSSDTEM